MFKIFKYDSWKILKFSLIKFYVFLRSFIWVIWTDSIYISERISFVNESEI